jgi:hypothetical protein
MVTGDYYGSIIMSVSTTDRLVLSVPEGRMYSNAARFADAAVFSRNAADTPEQCQDRITIATELGQRMQPGTPVLYMATSLEIHGGLLADRPEVTEIPAVVGTELAFQFTLFQANAVVGGTVRFRNLIAGTRFGDPIDLPWVAAGEQAIHCFVQTMHDFQRDAERAPGGIAWNDLSPLTELRLYAALADTPFRLVDIVGEVDAGIMYEQYLAAYQSGQYKHWQPDLERALQAIY